MFPKRYAECKVDGNEVFCHSGRVLLAMSEYESELASLRQKQVLWEAGNRELADRLEARDVAIDALRAEKERAEAERDEAIRMRDRHAEASKAQNEDITALMAERDAALKDAWKPIPDEVCIRIVSEWYDADESGVELIRRVEAYQNAQR